MPVNILGYAQAAKDNIQAHLFAAGEGHPTRCTTSDCEGAPAGTVKLKAHLTKRTRYVIVPTRMRGNSRDDH